MKLHSNLILPLFLGIFLFQNALAQSDFTIHFDGHDELFEQNIDAALAERPSQDELVEGAYLRYIQFEKIPTAATREVLEKEGLQFLHYVTFGAYLTVIPSDFDLEILKKHHARCIIKVQNNWKINPNLKQEHFEPWATKGDQLKVRIKFYDNANFDTSVESLRNAGQPILFKTRAGHWIETSISKTKIAEMAALPFVQHIELTAPPGEPEDNRGRALTRSNMINSASPMGKHYNGEGVAILVRDDGTVGPHIDVFGRMTDLANDNSPIQHAEGVTGIFAGAGNVDPYMKGMASGATIFNIDYEDDFMDNTMELHWNEGVKVTNSSYSDGCNDGYTINAVTVDHQSFENPTLLHVFSAGNSGNSDCDYGAGNGWGNITGGHKQGKNVIATANLGQHFILDNSSSKGPAHDGRLKPDISANGWQHFSLDPNNTYTEFGGTSGASPCIAGVSAQLMHAYKALNNGKEAEAALIKAAMLNTANDMGHIGPDYTYGWGHVNAARALNLLENQNYWKSSVDSDTFHTQNITIPAGLTQARFMVYWAEPAAAEVASKALINDLDLVVVTPSGDTLQPYVLNPTPIPALIDAPATHGRDSLNNMEQVAVFDPAAGDYQVWIQGTEVPFGPQDFYILLETIDGKPVMVYPNGGEGLVPGDELRIHWDAEGRTGATQLSYTLNGGNTWNNIATVLAEERFYDWTVPNVISEKVWFRIQIGMDSDMTDFSCSIVARPTDVEITKVCPASISVSFSPANDTLTHDIYLLGEKFMEVFGTASPSVSEMTLPIQGNAAREQWAAVAATHPSGLRGERTIAVGHAGGLLNCPQAIDLALDSLVSPQVTSFFSCGISTETITILVKNDGQNDVTGGTVSYQLGNQPVTTEPIGNIAVSNSLTYTFSTPVTLDTTATLPFRVWVNVMGDGFTANDSLQTTWSITTTNTTTPLQESFEGLDNFPPDGWLIDNPDDAVTWIEATVIGSSDTMTHAAHMDFYNYSDTGEEDFMFMIPLNLDNLTNPGIEFDLAYTTYTGNGYADALRIEVFPTCDLSQTPVQIYRKAYPELATIPSPQGAYWTPESKDDWRTDRASLQAFSGTVVVRFVAENDYGNSLFVDNINVTNVNIAPTVAAFTLSADTICRGESVTITDASSGENLSYIWNFDNGNPTSANTPGPHTVTYFFSAGVKNISLTLTGDGGTETVTRTLVVVDWPIANFAANQNGLEVSFFSASQNADTHFWDFGDGNTSAEMNPTHTYTMAGDYDVKLLVTGRCGMDSMTLNLMTVGTNTLSADYQITATPNPNQGQFLVFLQSPNSETMSLELNDASGKLIQQKQINTNADTQLSVEMGELGLPNGLYWLRIRNDVGERTLKMVVQR